MGYELIDTDDLDPLPDRSATGYEISDHYLPFRDADADPPGPNRGPRTFGFRVYFVEPGEALGTGGMHYHEEQEELFYVVDGTLHVQTPDTTFQVDAGQAMFIEPESPQRAFVPDTAEERAYVVAAGAPSYRELGRNDGRPVDPGNDPA